MPAPVKWSAADFELVNAENPEGHPWLSAAPDGRFSLLFFESLPGLPAHTDLEERVYNAAGASPVSIGTTFSAATIEHQPASAYLSDGRRVVVWTEAPTAGGGNLEDVYATVYYGNNIVALPRFLVTGGAGAQLDPVVAASDSGFVIALNDGSVAGGRLVLKFYNIAGTLINTVNAPDAPEGVNQTAAGEHRDVEITALANGNYVVTWADNAQFDIFARIFSPGGIALTGILDVEPGGAQATFPDVTALADGRFVVTYGQFAGNDVRGHIYEADGASAGSPFDIANNAINALQQQAQTAALHDGRFVTVWVTTTGNIAGQVTMADGTADGAAFAVNGDAAGDKGRPSIATLADGRFVVSWESGLGAAKTIFSTIFDPRETGLFGPASSFNDDWYGTAFSDTIFGGAGNDALRGAGASDFLHGDAGNDTLNGDAGDDTLRGGNGSDTMVGDDGNDTYLVDNVSDVTTETSAAGGTDLVQSSVTRTLGANLEKLTLTGAGAINGTGNTLANTITGNNGANTLSGGDGADKLNGGNGADTLNGGNGIDTLNGGMGLDALTGGSGSDKFLFNAAPAAANRDTVTDYNVTADSIEIANAAFVGIGGVGVLAVAAFHIGASAADASDRIIYNSATGALYFDADGLGGAAQIQFATLSAGLALTAADFVVI